MSDLKVGDEAVLDGHVGRFAFVLVVRETPKTWVLEQGIRVRKADLVIIGSSPMRIRKATQELQQKLTRALAELSAVDSALHKLEENNK